MSIIDYCGKIKLFDDYDLSLIEMTIKEFDVENIEETKFMKDINIRKDVELFWYRDKREEIQGGFHILSPKSIYINERRIKLRQDSEYEERANNVLSTFPVIVHELCHYSQMKKFGIVLYSILSLPLLRNVTIEPQAYMAEERMYGIYAKIAAMTPIMLAKLKTKYNFNKNYFDEKEKMALKEIGSWKYGSE